ncbi:THO complex subunit 7B-like [Chlorella sorokiniana]|uniref:THO complex subunit 7B-like n=1 Tax=Chlorella sorokiniana TaxID=3076 RepID=A0A2P6TD10_CHLSO|nr:THO complex subunit 7B-like [Chlorella sorokiniana]|eukprot:PRW20530.1 THO complex subunit 7B-like [Chlorella sorokiniana]
MASIIENEEAIIRKRYLTQTVATAANTMPPFKQLVKKYMRFCQVLQSGGAEEAERLHGELLALLYSIQFHMQKLQAMSGAFEREQQLYAEKQAQLQASIQQAEQDIEDRKRELEGARTELAHKQEYEAVKKLVMQVPSRAATLAEQEGTNKEIADLQQQSAELDALFEQRKQQFAGVLAALESLQRSIDRDEPEESVVALPEGAPAAAITAAAGAAGGQAAAARQPMQVG